MCLITSRFPRTSRRSRFRCPREKYLVFCAIQAATFRPTSFDMSRTSISNRFAQPHSKDMALQLIDVKFTSKQQTRSSKSSAQSNQGGENELACMFPNTPMPSSSFHQTLKDREFHLIRGTYMKFLPEPRALIETRHGIRRAGMFSNPRRPSPSLHDFIEHS